MSYYDFSGYALDPSLKNDTITTQPLPANPASETSMELYLSEAWSALSEVFVKLELAQLAQEEDDNNCENEELNREAEQFVQRIRALGQEAGRMQSDIMRIIYEHNHQN